MSSLSDDRVIGLVSGYFVPVWVSRDSYQLAAPGKADRDLLARIDASRRTQRLPGGAVCVYVVTADGEALATLPVGQAYKPDRLAAFLRELVDARKLTPRTADQRRASAAPPPERPRPKAADGMLFVVRSRFDARGDNRGTSRDLVELSAAEWAAFVPPTGAKVGHTWDVPRGVAEKLLRHGYPPLPHWNSKLAKVTACSLRCRVQAVAADGVRVRLHGRLEMVYPNEGKPTDGRITATLVGTALSSDGKVASFGLASDGARYVWSWQGREQVKPMSLAVERGP